MSPLRLRAASADAWSELNAALADLASTGRRTPCQIDPAAYDDEGPHARAEAAAACAGCPVLAACGEFADLNRESWLVWGGRSRAREEKAA